MITDKHLFDIIEREHQRQQRGIELIASENFVSDQVMAAMGSCLTNKYAEGYPGHRYYGGCEVVDEAEELARTRLKQLYGAEWVNVQPHSGAQANMAVFMAVLRPGDKFMGLNLAHGGHLSHGSPVNFSGLVFQPVEYNVTPDTNLIDYDQLEETARRERPRLIVGGAWPTLASGTTLVFAASPMRWVPSLCLIWRIPQALSPPVCSTTR